ncbi:hypothetical protein [Commensalibacter nepenthis]|uniref:YkuD domain-containing protein n=1 Tax=Commensalibacter nepenthis TaxID=3043872 RepID=A0ABT6QAG2_9PROT|nr:hypothetical protein [Commensalibacter sp. TBRC 10068]MDI2113899.1 hypothetical protein [Commensalibacter sp. TBRC 10068]
MTGRTATTNRDPNSSQTAVFEVRYTKAADKTGWLWIKLENDPEPTVKKTVSEYTKVTIQKKEGGRTYFLIQEGRYANQVGSLSDANVSKCLIPFKRGNGAVLNVKKIGRKIEKSPFFPRPYNQLFSTLSFNGKTARITIDSDVDFEERNPASPNNGKILHSKPLPDGKYKILAPTYSGNPDFTIGYRAAYPNLKADTVWFHIEYAPTYNSNFVHVGNLSEGCITCYEISKWNDLYDYLITNRLDSKGKYIGTLIIG